MWIKKYIKLLYPECIDQVDLYNAKKLKMINMPRFLYKYRDANSNNIKSLKNENIWFSSVHKMNDIYECSIFIGKTDKTDINQFLDRPQVKDYIKEKELKAFNLLNLNRKEILLKLLSCEIPNKTENQLNKIYNMINESREKERFLMKERFENAIKNLVFIYCLSETYKSTLMWNNYANEHKGFCIEYDFRSNETSHFLKESIEPVIYQDNIIDINRYLNSKVKPNKHLINYIASSKNSEWGYEKEWRVIFPIKGENKPFPLPGPKIKSINLGVNISDEDKNRLIKIAKNKELEIYQMKKRIDNYSMTRELIN